MLVILVEEVLLIVDFIFLEVNVVKVKDNNFVAFKEVDLVYGIEKRVLIKD